MAGSRLEGDWGRAFGTLPSGVDAGAIIERARLKLFVDELPPELSDMSDAPEGRTLVPESTLQWASFSRQARSVGLVFARGGTLGPRRREWVSFGAVAAALVAVSISAIVAGRPNDNVETTRPTPSPSPSQTQTSFEYFDGTIHGWRIAPSDVLEKEGLDRNLDLDCAPKQVVASSRTDLDFEISYLPKNIGKPSHPPYVGKWICGEMGLSVSWDMDWDDNPNEGIGSLRIDRFLVGSPSVGLYAPKDLVEACTLRERPAVCVHFEDDVKGRGHGGKIVVLEDDVFDPHAIVLRLTGVIGIPYGELLKIAEGIR